MRWLLFCALALLSLPAALAQVTPHTASSLLIDGSITNPVEVIAASPRASISSLEANISWFPQDRPGQEVTFFETFPAAEIDGHSALFSIPRPVPGHYSFDVEYQVRVTADHSPVSDKVRFPLPPVSGELLPFLLPTETIDVTPEISSLAASLAGDEDDLFLVVASLASWTREHISYDLSTVNVEASQPSSWVLANRQGVCDEMTNLFISMLRSLGVPARFVSGLAYTDSELFSDRWGAHGWAEVYFPREGWVPFDVTYGQLGWVDASHVVFATGVDSGKYASSYSWLGRDVGVEAEGMRLDASIVSDAGSLDPVLSLSVEPLEDELGIGSYQLVMARVANPSGRYVADELQLAFVDGFTMLDDAFRSVVLPPGGEVSLYWRLLVDRDLDRGYHYRFPLLLRSQRGSEAEGGFRVVPGEQKLSLSWVDRFVEDLSSGVEAPYSDEVSFSCGLPSGVVPRPGVEFEVECSLVNGGGLSLRGVEVCYEETCRVVDVPVGDARTVSFPVSFSEQSLYALAFSATGSVVERRAYVSLEVSARPSLRLENLSHPAVLGYHDEGVVHFEVVHVSGSPPVAVTVSLAGPRVEKSWSFDEFSGRKVFDITVSGDSLSLDDDRFVVSVEYHDEVGALSRVEESFSLPLGEVSWWQRFLLWLGALFE
ncbi:transglutaminase domain-containing protein [Candidatus Woesearchaeota archaeon]|nr:transglutaminase domain-containing protein [Candidatus Woesearchaeota archaeon]